MQCNETITMFAERKGTYTAGSVRPQIFFLLGVGTSGLQ